MAKRICGTPDRLDQAGLLGQRCCVWRTASSPPAQIVSGVLQRGSHAFITRQGCTGFTESPGTWQDRCQAAPRRISPSIRPDLISGRDKGLAGSKNHAIVPMTEMKFTAPSKSVFVDQEAEDIDVGFWLRQIILPEIIVFPLHGWT